jgi:hypothetical protein
MRDAGCGENGEREGVGGGGGSGGEERQRAATSVAICESCVVLWVGCALVVLVVRQTGRKLGQRQVRSSIVCGKRVLPAKPRSLFPWLARTACAAADLAHHGTCGRASMQKLSFVTFLMSLNTTA